MSTREVYFRHAREFPNGLFGMSMADLVTALIVLGKTDMASNVQEWKDDFKQKIPTRDCLSL